MIHTDTIEIEKIVLSETNQSEGICLTEADIKEMTVSAGKPFATIETESSDDISNITDELLQSIKVIGSKQIKGICIQIHSLTLKMGELSYFRKSLCPLFDNNDRIIIRCFFDNAMQSNSHKLVAILFG